MIPAMVNKNGNNIFRFERKNTVPHTTDQAFDLTDTRNTSPTIP